MSGYLTGAFGVAPPASSGNDPFFSYVVLLLPYEGNNGATSGPGFVDLSPHAHVLTTTGSATISTTQFQYGVSSLHAFAGGNTIVDNPDWLLSSANSDQFTVEFSTWLTSTPLSKNFICQVSVNTTLSWSVFTDASGHIEFTFSPDGTFASQTVITSTVILATSTWIIIAVDKDATGKIRLYKDGTMIGNATPANSAFFDSAQNLGIGENSIGGGQIDGYLDNIRITKGIARYASDGGYTPATAAFPTS